MFRQFFAAFSMLLLLQLSLQAGGAACELEHGRNTTVSGVAGQTSAVGTAMLMSSSMDMAGDMPVESHPPCSDTQGPKSCDGPWALTTCVTMASCHAALTVSSALSASIEMTIPPMSFGAFPPLHASATVTPQPPPPRA